MGRWLVLLPRPRRVRVHGREALRGDDGVSVALNYALTNFSLKRFEDVKALLRKLLPVARRVLGENNEVTLRMRINYAMALFVDDTATLEDTREAVTTLEDVGRIARRVLGSTHPVATGVRTTLRDARARLRAREAPTNVGECVRTTQLSLLLLYVPPELHRQLVLDLLPRPAVEQRRPDDGVV